MKTNKQKNLMLSPTSILQGKKEFMKRASMVPLKPQAPLDSDGKELLHSLVDAAALLILYIGRGRFPYL